MSESSADCVIVGSGIGGAVLALILGRAGKHVVLLEREEKPIPQPRPEIHAHPTFELFGKLGVRDRILKEAALPLQGLRLERGGGGVLIEFTAAEFKRFEVQPYSVDPSLIRAILVDEAKASGNVEVRHGANVRELVYHGMHIQGVRALENKTVTTWRAPLTVGDDGGNSIVRRAMAIPIKLNDFPIDFLSQAGTEFRLFPDECGHVWVDPRRYNRGVFGCLNMPQPGGKAALLFTLSPQAKAQYLEEVPSPRFRDDILRLCPPCEKLSADQLRADRQASFHRAFGHARRYVGDGGVLMGDAAHPVTPAGGQGANMSIADAAVLADVALKGYEKNHFTADILAPYETLRRPANERSMQFSIRANRIFRALRWTAPLLGPYLLNFLEGAGKDETKKRQFIQAVSHAFESRATSADAKEVQELLS
jgi:2-polyprenyl-6-methoxyphenol hydroxylase-like FAD-dependent oxidoreductase